MFKVLLHFRLFLCLSWDNVDPTRVVCRFDTQIFNQVTYGLGQQMFHARWSKLELVCVVSICDSTRLYLQIDFISSAGLGWSSIALPPSVLQVQTFVALFQTREQPERQDKWRKLPSSTRYFGPPRRKCLPNNTNEPIRSSPSGST
eukprot:Selendium_serpulae@DN2037_c0_g1_i3.p2